MHENSRQSLTPFLQHTCCRKPQKRLKPPVQKSRLVHIEYLDFNKTTSAKSEKYDAIILEPEKAFAKRIGAKLYEKTDDELEIGKIKNPNPNIPQYAQFLAPAEHQFYTDVLSRYGKFHADKALKSRRLADYFRLYIQKNDPSLESYLDAFLQTKALSLSDHIPGVLSNIIPIVYDNNSKPTYVPYDFNYTSRGLKF